MAECPCRVMDKLKPVFEDCCGPIIQGKLKAKTAEALMRSRYSAYVLKNMDHIDVTQLNEKHEVFNKEEALKWAENSDWNGIEILSTVAGQEKDANGQVEFIAHYKDKTSGTVLKHHETSLFVREKGDWKFKEGHVHGAQPVKRLLPKLGRNDPCHCGSGKKFKKCHGA